MAKKEIVIDHMTDDAAGVSYYDKKPMYTMYGITGETILANIDYIGKRNVFSSIDKIIKPAPCRVDPKCNVYYQCGGCHLSHMSYEGQLEFKTNVVRKLFRNGGFENINIHQCVGQDIPYFYRNKVQVPVKRNKKNIVAGFYKEDTHEVIPFDICYVQDKLSNKIVKQVVMAMKENRIEPYNEDTESGIIRHILIRRAAKETMLVLVTKVDSFAGRNNFVKALRNKLPELTTIVQNVNKRHTNVILGEKENILYGKGFISDTLCGITFKISPKSFYQINKEQCEKLYTKAIDLASLKGDEIVLDAYCGIGTIGMIASKKAKEVIGVEVVEDAIIDAKTNAKNNNISNCKFYCADATEFMVKNRLQKIDVVFIDPPRKGSTERFLHAVSMLKPQKIVYISCNPETQVKDIQYLVNHGYEFGDVYPFDMFPQTFHVETVCCLSRKNFEK